MPIVEVRAIGKLKKEQKAEITRRFTKILEEVASKPPEYTYVIFEEVDAENWGHKGKLFSEQ
jgi:4-oxalocrotonate tautomerase